MFDFVNRLGCIDIADAAKAQCTGGQYLAVIGFQIAVNLRFCKKQRVVVGEEDDLGGVHFVARGVQFGDAADFAIERTVFQQFDERCFNAVGDFIGRMLFRDEVRFHLEITGLGYEIPNQFFERSLFVWRRLVEKLLERIDFGGKGCRFRRRKPFEIGFRRVDELYKRIDGNR